MANTTFSFAKAISLTDYLPAFIQRYDKQSWPWEKIYSIKPTTNATEQVFSYAGFGQARKTGELDSIYYENMSELAATTFTV